MFLIQEQLWSSSNHHQHWFQPQLQSHLVHCYHQNHHRLSIVDFHTRILHMIVMYCWLVHIEMCSSKSKEIMYKYVYTNKVSFIHAYTHNYFYIILVQNKTTILYIGKFQGKKICCFSRLAHNHENLTSYMKILNSSKCLTKSRTSSKLNSQKFQNEGFSKI